MKGSNFIKVHNGQVQANLDVYVYMNDGFMIAYAPALDLMGYGKTDEDAKASFEIVFQDFLDYSFKNNTFEKYLLKHGWTAKRSPASYVPPTPVELIEKNKKLQDIFALDYSKQALPVSFAFC